jgi:hypothetical protein
VRSCSAAAGEVVALKKNCACHADRRKHDDSSHGYKQTALSPKRPHPSSLPLPTNGETNVEELQRPFLRSSQGSYYVTLADQAAAGSSPKSHFHCVCFDWSKNNSAILRMTGSQCSTSKQLE